MERILEAASVLAFALPAAGAQQKVTFSEDVAPIVFGHCTQCHRAAEIAPFPLVTYRDVKKRARTILRAVKMKLMPPWHPVEGHGEFAGENIRLSQRQIATLERWVEGGRLEGDPKRLPPMPKFTSGWQLGQPDLVVRMPKGFEIYASGRDIYRNFVVPLSLDEDKWLTAIEVRPSARAVLHHIIFSLDSTGEARRLDGQDGRPGFRGMGRIGRSRGRSGFSTSGLGGWAVGGQPRHLPLGLARKLPRGADLVLQSHLHPSGKPEVEQTTLGLYFTDKPPERTMVGIQLPPFFGIAAGLNIPAGKKDFRLTDEFTLPVDVEALTVGGHAHYLCRQMQVWATPPGGKRKSIFWIDDWDFNWQNRYQYARPLQLKAGTKISVSIQYDNSKDSPGQQFDPPRFISWGPQSTDEMGSITLLVVPKRERDADELRRAYRSAAREKMRGRRALDGFMQAFIGRIKALDKNNDGKVEMSEVPRRYRRFARRLDTNGDGVIDEKEMRRLGGLRR